MVGVTSGSFYAGGGFVGGGGGGGGGYADLVEALGGAVIAETIPAQGSWDLGSDSYLVSYSSGTLTVDQTAAARTNLGQSEAFLGFSNGHAAWAAKTYPETWGLLCKLSWTTLFTDHAAQPTISIVWQPGITYSRTSNIRSKGRRLVGAAPNLRGVQGTAMLTTLGVGASDYVALNEVWALWQVPTSSGITLGDTDPANSSIWCAFNHAAAGSDTADTLEGMSTESYLIPLTPNAT